MRLGQSATSDDTERVMGCGLRGISLTSKVSLFGGKTALTRPDKVQTRDNPGRA